MIGKRWEDLEPVRRRLRWLRALCITLAVGSLMAAAGKAGYRMALWKATGEAARCVAGNGHAPPEDRVQAIVGIQRDRGLHVALLQQMAQEPGEIGEHARNALTHLRERLR